MAARVIVMAGGTGGHVFPALAVAQELRARGCDVSWLGTPDSFEARTVPQYDFALDTIDAYRMRGQGLVGKLFAPLRLLRAMTQALLILRRHKPQLVIGMGGFAAGPGGLVSRLLSLPLVIHEQNAIPGLTNRWLSRIATRSLQAFPHSFDDELKAEVTGNPVRPEISALAAPEQRSSEKPIHLLVMGGSLGAQALNETLPLALALMPGVIDIEVHHQAGRGKLEETKQAYAEAGVSAVVSEFLTDMPAAYAQADLVICRSGALTVSELAAAGVASVLVPFPHAVDDHQTKNAEYLVEAGAAVLIQQRDMTAQVLADLICGLCDEGRLQEMALAARAQAKPKATSRVADICMEVMA